GSRWRRAPCRFPFRLRSGAGAGYRTRPGERSAGESSPAARPCAGCRRATRLRAAWRILRRALGRHNSSRRWRRPRLARLTSPGSPPKICAPMARRLLVLGAGSGASNNLIGSLRADPSLHIVGCHADRFVLNKSPADRNYLVLPTEHRGYLDSLRRVIAAERIDLLIPNSDGDVLAVARRRGWCPCRLFLPRRPVIERCQDKYDLSVFLRRHGVPAPRTWPIRRLADVDRIFRGVG